MTLLGGGELILSGSDRYTGGTTVTSGTLDFSTPESMPTAGILTIASGGEVALGALVDNSNDSEPAVAAVATGNASAGGDNSGQSAIEALLARIRAGRAAEAARGDAAGPLDGVVASASPAGVPEPSTFALLGIAAIAVLGYCPRRRGPRRPKGCPGHGQEQPPMLLGFVAAAHFVERAGQMIMNVGIVGVIAQGALEGGDGQLPLARLGQHAAQVRPGFDVVLVQLDGHVVAFPGGRRSPRR